MLCVRGCSSNGRALALHARGTGFDPPHLHLEYFFFPMFIVVFNGLYYGLL